MKSNKSGFNSILAAACVPVILIVFIFPTSGNAFFKKPWDHIETAYLKKVASYDISYFDGDWNGTLRCSGDSSSSSILLYRDFNIKNRRGVSMSASFSRKQNGYRYSEIKIAETGETTIQGEYYQNGLKKIKFSGQIGIDPDNYYRQIMWLKGSLGSRSCECKFDREVPLVTKRALADEVPLYADFLRKLEEEEAQRLAKEKEERERKEAEAQRLAQIEKEKMLKEEEARRIAAEKAEKKRQKMAAIEKAKILEISFDKTTRFYLQHALQQLGHYRGKVDGAFGPGTRRAIKAYQKKSGKPATGYLDEADIANLMPLGKVVFEKAKVEREFQEKEAQRLAKERAERERKEAEAQRLAEEKAERERKEAEARRLAEEQAERERKEAEARRIAQEEAKRKQQEAADAEHRHREAVTQSLAEEKVERQHKEAHSLAQEMAKSEYMEIVPKQQEIAAAERKRQEAEARGPAEEKAEHERKEAEARRLAEERAERERKQAAQLKEELKAEIKKQLEVELERERRLAARSSKDSFNGYKFVDASINFRTLNAEVGCQSNDPISVQNEKFARRYKDKIFVLPGRLMKLEGHSALVDLDDGQPDISIDLIPGQDLQNLEQEMVTIEFIMKKKGGCFSLFQGERGIVYKNSDSPVTGSTKKRPIKIGINAPMISPWSTNPNTTKNRPYVFRACFLDIYQAPMIANFIKNEFGYIRAAVLYDIHSDYPKGLAEVFKMVWEEQNGSGSIVAFESFKTRDTDFSSQLTNIINSSAEIL